VQMNELAEQLKVEFGDRGGIQPQPAGRRAGAAGAFGEDYPRTEKTGRPSTQAKHLEMIDHPAVIAFKAHDDRRRLFTYLENARLVAARTDGRIHPQVNIHKARTGRASYDNPALQQFTASARQILLADEDDRMVSIDWASIEPVTAANIAGDTMLIERFEAGEKIYDVISPRCLPTCLEFRPSVQEGQGGRAGQDVRPRDQVTCGGPQGQASKKPRNSSRKWHCPCREPTVSCAGPQPGPKSSGRPGQCPGA
jgi:hypothetical protein